MHSRSAPRRRHSAELRAQVMAQCDAPSASVAAVAQVHGLNANLVHKWRRQSASGNAVTRVLELSRVPEGSAIAKAIDYSLKHWMGLGRFLLDGDVPIDNNYVENRIRPWALGRRKWLFIGSQLAGERAAVVMSLLQSARLNGHEPWAYLKDVLTRLPTQFNRRIEELLLHKWQPAS